MTRRQGVWEGSTIDDNSRRCAAGRGLGCVAVKTGCLYGAWWECSDGNWSGAWRVGEHGGHRQGCRTPQLSRASFFCCPSTFTLASVVTPVTTTPFSDEGN